MAVSLITLLISSAIGDPITPGSNLPHPAVPVELKPNVVSAKAEGSAQSAAALQQTASATSTGDVITVMPFENLSGRAEYNWLGEAFAEKLSTLINQSGLNAIQPDERDVAYKEEGLPPTVVLTHATMFKIAERAGANLVVLGTYRVDGDGRDATITFSARTIDINQGRQIGREQNAGGPILELERLQGELAYQILSDRNPSLGVTRDQVVTASTAVPIGAFENLIKGKLTLEHEAKVGFIERAIKEYADKTNGGKYSAAYFELGRIKYDDRKYSDAIEAFKNVDDKFPRSDEASFYLAASEYQLGQTEKALNDFDRIKASMPLYEVYNNIGVIYLKQKQYAKALETLRPATAAATRDTDTLFNLGYAYYISGDFKNAAETLKDELDRRGNDGQAAYMLGKALETTGDKDQSRRVTDDARRLLPEYAQWETRGIPFLGRLKETFIKANYYRYKRDQQRKLGPSPVAADSKPQIDQLLASAKSAFSAGRDEEALAALGKILQAAPQNYEAHLLMGQIFERRGDTERATNELKASLFWNPRLIEAQILLGRIALLRNDCQSAQNAADEAQKIDSGNQEVQALKKLIDQKCKQTVKP